MQHGALTARLGSFLSGALKQQAVDVLYDHGRQVKNALTPVGRLSAWFGDHYGANSLLAHIDLAVVEHGSDKALALVEIEETTDKPKVLLGDVLAIRRVAGLEAPGNRQFGGHAARERYGVELRVPVAVNGAGRGEENALAVGREAAGGVAGRVLAQTVVGPVLGEEGGHELFHHGRDRAVFE